MPRFSAFQQSILIIVILFSITANGHTADDDTTTVSTVALGTLLNTQSKSFPATVVSENMAKISAKVNAEITSLPLLVGDTVTAGQTIASLDCDIYKLEVEAARAALDMAAEDLTRIKALKNKSVVSAQQLTAASVAQRQASVQHKQAKLRTKYCDVAAPFAGVITKRFASLGDFAAVGMPLLELVQTDKTEVQVLLPVDVAANLTSANEMFFKQAESSTPLQLRTVLPIIDQTTKTREARFTSQTSLVSGSFGRLIWQSGSKAIAPDMLQIRNGQSGLFIAQSGKAVFHPLPDAVIGKPLIIDLPENTAVITTGRHSIIDGQKIDVQ